jgi:hypothetical protein
MAVKNPANRGMIARPSDLAKHVRQQWRAENAKALSEKKPPLINLPKNRQLLKAIQEMLSEPPQEQIRANKSK